METRLWEMATMADQGRLASGPVVPAVSHGFTTFLRDDFTAAIATIEPVLAQHERIGGSCAQRDLAEFILLKAYLGAGRPDNSRRMLAQRRPGPCGVPVAGVSALL